MGVVSSCVGCKPVAEGGADVRRGWMETVTAETASRRQSAATRVWGSVGSAEIFAEGTAYTATKRDVHCAGLARYRQGVVGGVQCG
jgi:hypothetical protein